MDTPPWTAPGMDLVYPRTAEMKQNPHPQRTPFTPNSGNPSREQQPKWGGMGQGQPSASGAQGPGFCCPLFLGLSRAEPGAELDPCGPFQLGIFRDPH